MIRPSIRVDLGDRSYPIYLGDGMVDSLGEVCVRHRIPRHLVILADRNSARAALNKTASSLKRAGFHPVTIVMPAGERQKSLVRAEAILTSMLRQHVPRQAALLALGGGVVGDVGGFVASTYRRGLVFIQCPTTLLSQVDSSVGGKNGVNHALGKNAIGTFLQPAFVFSDVRFLRTLPRREAIAGLGEILKYPLVFDPDLLTYLEDHLEEILRCAPERVLHVASRCLAIKAGLVSEDECEVMSDRGRFLLNVGHVVGHALETLSRYSLRHGEAVLLGILAEGHVAMQRGGFSSGDLDRLTALYRRLGRRFDLRRITNSAIVRFVFRKEGVRFVLPAKPGRVAVVNDVTPDELRRGLTFLRNL